MPDVLKGYDDSYLWCKYERRHALEYDTNPPLPIGGRPPGIPRSALYEHATCVRCSTVRTRWLLADGTKTGPHYTYPDNYRFPKNDTPDLITINKEMFRRRTLVMKRRAS